MPSKQHLRDFHAGWHDPIPQIIEAAENIVVTDTLDVATLPTWSRKRTLLIGDAAHATSPHAGQGASLALEDAMRLGRLMQDGQELGLTFQNFEAERRPRAEKIVALARRNGNSKREFSATGAWIRDRMLKLLLPVTAKGMDWMYAYDPRRGVERARVTARRKGGARRVGAVHTVYAITLVPMAGTLRFAHLRSRELLLHRERQPGMVDQPLDQLVSHRRTRRPDAGWNVRRVAQQADRAFRDHLRGRAIAGIAIALHRRRGPGGHRARSRRTADRRGRSRALPSTAPRPASARRGRSFRCWRPSRSLALASPFSPAPVSTISS